MDNTLGNNNIDYCLLLPERKGGGDKGKGAGRTKVRVEEGRQKEEKEKRRMEEGGTHLQLYTNCIHQ